LHHAHTRLDANGRPLNIVHRDVSPQNILLARQGDVKISDFGIAKAADSVVRTEAGIQIGKLCYMAPEQARGDPLDGRADLYSLGIVLWECLAMRPLFPREEGAEALRSVLEPKHVAPSEASPHAPAALDAVVLKALAPKREDRYPDAGSLARDLRVYVHSVSPGFGQADLAQFLERTLPFQGAPRVAPIPPTGQTPSQPPTVSERPAPARPAILPPPGSAPTSASGSAWPAPKDGGEAALAAPGPPPAPQAPVVSSPAKLVVFWVLLTVLLVGGAAGAFIAMRGEAEPPPAPSPPAQPAVPSGPSPTQPAPLPQTGLVPVNPAQNVTITPGPPSQIPVDVPKMSLQLRTEPTGASIVNDGEIVGTTPMDVQAPIGRPMKIALLLRGYEPRVFLEAPESVPALASGSGSSPIVLVPTTRAYGIVWISMAEQAHTAQVVVDGAVVGETPMPVIVRFVAGTPVTRIDIDLPGHPRHNIDAKTVAITWGFAEYSHNLARLGDPP
jgi:hypothetical protein